MYSKIANLAAVTLVMVGLVFSAWVFTKTPAHGRTDLDRPESEAVVEVFDDFIAVENFHRLDDQANRILSNEILDLSQVKTVDLVHIDPSSEEERHQLALSFGFSDGRFLAVKLIASGSSDADYSLLQALVGGHELSFIIGSETAVIGRHSHQKKDRVYLYKVYENELFARSLLHSLVTEIAHLNSAPSRFSPFGRNGRNGLLHRVLETKATEKPISLKSLMPSYSSQMAYDLHLIDTTKPFSEIKRRSLIDPQSISLAAQSFSLDIRK